MRILIDADGFPSVRKIISLSKKYNIECLVFFDFNHEFTDDYAKVYLIASGPNAVDLVIQNESRKNDIVLTNDYGVAVVALSKCAKALNSNGLIYTNDNIDYLLEMKDISRRERKTGRVKGPKKRTNKDEELLLKRIEELIKNEEIQEK